MSNELIRLEFTEEQVMLIKQQIAPNASSNELKLFMHQCRRTGLDPLTKQIYCIHRGGKMTIQTSIDGFRVIAERSGSYAGQDEPIWVDDETGNPIKCTVTVYRFSVMGERYAAGVGVAYFKEYYPFPSNLQKSMPHNMISKVAEALALRKAFPQDLSGLVTSEEMNETQVPQPEFGNEPMKIEMPGMNEILFEKALTRVKKGEADLFEKVSSMYSLTEKQTELFQQAIEPVK